MPFFKCRFCGKQFSDKLTVCPFCKKDLSKVENYSRSSAPIPEQQPTVQDQEVKVSSPQQKQANAASKTKTSTIMFIVFGGICLLVALSRI